MNVTTPTPPVQDDATSLDALAAAKPGKWQVTCSIYDGFEASVEIDTAERLGNIAHFRHCATAYEVVALREAANWIDDEAPASEPSAGPTVGFQSSGDPEQDDGNDTVREAFDEGVRRGLWIAAERVRAALTGVA